MRKIAIITARGGSKGLPDKNMLMAGGRPLLGYTIEAALESGVFERIVLTTDSDEYIDLLAHYPIDFHRRPDRLATDTSSSFDVLEDVLLQPQYQGYDYFVLLQPTSPMRTAQHIIDICQDFEANCTQYDFMTSVTQAHKPTVLTRGIDTDRSLKHFDIDYSRYARQNYLPEYSPNGVFFIAKPEAYLEQKHFYGARCLAHFMDRNVSIDIDDRDDFEHFYFLLQRQKREELLRAQTQRELYLKEAFFAHKAELSLVGDAHLAQWIIPSLGGKSIQNVAITTIRAEEYLDLLRHNAPLRQSLRSSLGKQIVLSLGINDIRREKGDISQLAQEILEVAKELCTLAPESKIYLLELPLTLFRVDCKNSDIELLNSLLKQGAEQSGELALSWLALPSSFRNKYNKLDQRLTDDGLNLNAEGYELLAETIQAQLA